jgi:hypothetical protein
MKKITPALIFLAFILIHLNVKANKSYLFTYDATGNRLTVAFTSTCGERLRDTTLNTKDTIIEKAITEIVQVSEPKAYPNPVSEYFILSLPVLEKVATMEIYDMNGDLIFKDIDITTSHNIIKTCDFAAGATAGGEKVDARLSVLF